MPSKLTATDVADWRSVPNVSDTTPWYHNAGMMQLNFFLSVIAVSQALNGYDGTITGSLMALDSWNNDLDNPNASLIGLLNAMPYISGMLCGPLGGYVMDRFGRKWVLRWYGVSMIIGTILGCIAGAVSGKAGYALFCVGKLVIGSGLAPGLMCMQAMIHEIAHPRYRSFCAAAFNSNWTLGSVVGTLITFGTSHRSDSWSWRIPYLIQIPLSLYIIIAIQFMPETPRFLLAKGRADEARSFFARFHGNGNINDPLVQWEIEETTAAINAEREAKAERWGVILRNPIERRRIAIACMMTFVTQMDGSSIVSHYYSVQLKLVGIASQTSIIGIGIGISMMGYIAQLIGSWATGKIGRRPQVLYSWVLEALFQTAVCVSSAMFVKSGNVDTSAGTSAIAFVWLFNFVSGFAQPVFYSYPAEILSYSSRAKGMTFWNTVNQSFGLYGAYVNSVALAAITYWYYCVYLGLIVIQWFMMYFWMPETFRLTLEEIDIIFYGHEAAVAKADANLEAAMADHVIKTDSASEK